MDDQAILFQPTMDPTSIAAMLKTNTALREAVRSIEMQRLRERIDAVSRAAGDLMRAIRPDGPCMICAANVGTKHKADCVVWPLILARHELDTGERVEQITERAG